MCRRFRWKRSRKRARQRDNNIKAMACFRTDAFLEYGQSVALHGRSGNVRQRLALTALITIVLALGGIFAVLIWDAEKQERLGVHFPISCSAASQQQFDFATARLHTLRFNESDRIYGAIAEAEPDCAIAYWGMAMSRVRRPVPGSRLPDDLRAGREALRSAAGARVATPRERAYIAALGLLFGESGAADWDDRTIAYEQAMGILAAHEHDDLEAKIFYALALNLVPRALDKDFLRQTKATEVLLVALGEQPHHPGLSHYLTYCLRAPEEESPDVPILPEDQFISSIESGLAIIALLGVGAFFVAVWPVWSPAKS